MDYVVGSVAALVAGNVTPNRPKFLKRALTPIKHQPSPNVTPKSELVDDRSIFLSPTMQKKKAIVKKSPKRIFENPDLDVSNDGEDNLTKSPKADKVKKHLRDELEADSGPSPKSPRTKMSKIKESEANVEFGQIQNINTPKKKKNQDSGLKNEEKGSENKDTNSVVNSDVVKNSPHINKTKKKKNKILNCLPKVDNSPLNNFNDDNDNDENESNNSKQQTPISPKKKNKLSTTKEAGNDAKYQIENYQEGSSKNDIEDSDKQLGSETVQNVKKSKKRKNKSKAKISNNQNIEMDIKKKEVENINDEEYNGDGLKKKKIGNKQVIVNPNAVTDKDSDSEHESDDEIESENEQNNKEVLDTGPADESSDEEEKIPAKKETVTNNKEPVVETEEQIKRTLFVGNVLFSAKCKKEIKKIFSKYGQIETVRIRTVPVKDGRVTPKLAVIKNELHPDRSTVNVYVKFLDASSVYKALAENGKVLNGHHLRVTRSDSTGSEHDPKCSIFIGNLPFGLEDEALHQKFQQCGEIETVRIIRDKKTNAGKGFGYVNFKSKDAVELALALTEEDLTIKNRIIRVKRCTQITHKQRAQQVDNRRPNFQGNSRENIQRNRREQGNFRGGQNVQRSFRGNASNYGRQGQFENRQPRQNGSKEDGAYRRLMNKRRNQDDGADGPQNKRQRNMSYPGKKERKEFVGMTAEKKKKHKIAKGQKKKKALSEILTKQ